MAGILKLSIARTADGIGLPLPSYASKYHVGLNLQLASAAPIRLEPGDRVYVPIGFAIGIPAGYCGFVISSSILARKHGVIIPDAPSLVSPADRGPLFVLLQNISSQLAVLHRGDVVAQMVIQPTLQAAWNDLTPEHITGKATLSKDVLVDRSRTRQTEYESDVTPKRIYKGPRNRFSEEEEE